MIFKTIGDRRGEGVTIANLGSVYKFQGKKELALSCFDEAAAILRQLGQSVEYKLHEIAALRNELESGLLVTQ